MEVSKKSVYQTSFGRGPFQGNLLSFENESDLQINHLASVISQTSFYYRLLPRCSGIAKSEM